MRMSKEEQLIFENGLSAVETVKFCKKHKNDFIHYFETIIDRKGKVYFAVPSHEQKILQLAKDQYKFNKNEVDKYWLSVDYLISRYGYIATRYETLDVPGVDKEFISEIYHLTPTRSQLRTIKILKRAGLICENPNVIINSDYTIYKYRAILTGEKEN